MHPEDIKAALKKQGMSQRAVATRCGVAPATVNCVIYGSTKSERIATVIAQIIGIDRADLWPGRYQPRHERFRQAF